MFYLFKLRYLTSTLSLELRSTLSIIIELDIYLIWNHRCWIYISSFLRILLVIIMKTEMNKLNQLVIIGINVFLVVLWRSVFAYIFLGSLKTLGIKIYLFITSITGYTGKWKLILMYKNRHCSIHFVIL